MTTAKKLIAAAGAAGAAGEATYVEDVFSTYLYEGTNSTQGIPNGINLGDFGVGTSTRFNGTGDHLSRSSDLTGNADGKTFTFSCWVFLPPMDDRAGNTNQRVLYATDSSDNGVAINVDSSGQLGIEVGDGSGSWKLQATASTAIGTNVWTHILVSVDMANSSNRYVYLNDVAASVTWNVYTDTNLDFTRSTHYIGVWGNGTSRYFYDDMAHLYLDYTYRDLSTESNRRIFIDANGGSTSASSLAALNPIMYLPMTDAYAVGKNAGTGGDFTASGSPTIVENGTEYVADSGKGGLVWLKNRSLTVSHRLVDTERGVSNRLESDTANAEYFQSGQFVTAFNSNGFTVDGSETGANDGYTPSKYASWTFRKQEKFFDIVKYTGTGSARDIAHNLGSVPGMVIIKSLDRTYKWIVSHRSFANLSEYISLNETSAKSTDANVFGSSSDSHTATTFHVGTDSYGNQSGDEYVAYLFAHNDGDGEFGEDGDQDIIKCGSFTTSAGSDFSTAVTASVNLGFEPQWILMKAADGTGGWLLIDSMRGITTPYSDFSYLGNDNFLSADTSAAEVEYGFANVTSTGFNVYRLLGSTEYIYMAIHRPHKPASELTATDLFKPVVKNFTAGLIVTGFPVDLNVNFGTSADDYNRFTTRLTGPRSLYSDRTAAETSETYWDFAESEGMGVTYGGNISGYSNLCFKRAPGFFDVVTYTGNGTGQNIPHSLGVAPEMMWIKRRNYDYRWTVYYPEATNQGTLELNTNTARGLNSSTWNSTAPTATHFTVGTDFSVNHTHPYIAYLFASVAGISKVGSYTGTGNDLNVDCGFSAGARFVMVKRTDSTGDWYFWDTARGIVAGNDPYHRFNVGYPGGQDVTNTDYIDPLSSGFTITSSAPAALNASGGSYLFYAIA